MKMEIWKTKDEKNESSLQSGTWNNINLEEKREKIKFEFDKPVEVTMQSQQPREIPWETGVFYVFDVLYEGEEKCITTSAWTLLRGLKTFEPLEGKRLTITKMMDKGKQVYKVEEQGEEKVE
jgi:hypothetical protein